MKKILPLILVLSISTSVFAKDFSDVRESSPYFNATQYLSQIGVINGYSDGTFKPYNEINRAELLKLLIEGAGISIQTPSSNCFPDTPYNQWYSPYICTAKTLGFINGYPDGTFKPAQKINKVEAIKMLGEVYSWQLPKTSTPLYDDTPINQWYIPYLSYAKTKNLLPESGAEYKPESNMIRGSISETLYRYLITKELDEKMYSEDLKIDLPEETDLKISKTKFQNTVLAPGEIKIVLSWDTPDPNTEEETEIPVDLDAHLIQPNDEEIYFAKKISSNVDSLMEIIDGDEVINIRNYQDGTYEYFVNNFAGEQSFTSVNAKVEIYDQNGLAGIFYPEEEWENKLWEVFELSEDREIIEINKIGNCELITKITVVCPEI
ncbi:MAG: S-layer homology domain-containing protein [bacterium]|nr:S-layer homology domain-containing protein [bacterium]